MVFKVSTTIVLFAMPLLAAGVTAFVGTTSKTAIPARRGHAVPRTSFLEQQQAVLLLSVKESTFGMGCFWEPSESLLKVDGVIDTVAGYTGNPSAAASNKAPTYDNVCFGRQSWVEGVRVIYDEDKISYEELLEAFFEAQKPQMGSRQYASIIFPHDAEQDQIAKNWIQENATRARQQDGRTPQMTSIEAKTKFFQAEGYHQRYWQKQRPRFAAILGLLAIATGIMDPIVPEAYQQTVVTAANSAVLLAGLGILLERKILDVKVVELL
jgi:peptide-methionine (S)-S-oxide reductase